MTAELAVPAEVESEALAAIGADMPILAVQIIRRGAGADVATARAWVSARVPGWPPPVEPARPASRDRIGHGRRVLWFNGTRWVWQSWVSDAAERRIESVLRARSRREVRRARKAAQR